MEIIKETFGGDILLKGKHATYAKFLSPTTEKKEKIDNRKPADIFKRVIDVYMVAAVIGLERGLRANEDKTSSDEVRIFAGAVNTEKLNLEFIYNLVMLVDNSQGLSADEKISRAFKNDNPKVNFELFTSYVRGGIEWLYEQFSQATIRDEYLEKVFEMVRNFKEEYALG